MANSFINTIVFVSDLEKSKKFYADTLDIKIKQDLKTIIFFENQLVLHSAESILNTVFNEKNLHEKQMGRKNILLYFETDDLDGLYSRLKTEVDLIHEIKTQEWGQRVFRFYDPDGHIVEFGEPHF